MSRPPALPSRLPLLALLLGLLLAPLMVSPATAQGLPEPLRKSLRDDNPVVAVVNGTEIYWNDVVLSALDLPAE